MESNEWMYHTNRLFIDTIYSFDIYILYTIIYVRVRNFILFFIAGSTTNKTTRPTTYENTGKTTLELTTTQNKATSSSTTEIATQGH